MNTLGKRLKKAREEANLSMSELARRSDVRVGTIDGIEKGKTKTSSKTITLAEALGCSEIWLAHGKGDPWATKSAEVAYKDDRLHKFFEIAESKRESGELTDEMLENLEGSIELMTRILSTKTPK
ncbi:MAG: transcriptional regulator with XRE-family HTH domain [Flavobacteriales bacterium]|jgi:transcriptional regulator with XRE-family HTH domain